MNPAELASEIEQLVRSRLAEGFDARDSIIPGVVESLGDQAPAEQIEPLARVALAQAVADRARDQASWPAITDCDRLDAAFEELNARGIMARHNWWCCTNCGRSVMPNEFDRLGGEFEGTPIIGYTFYHNQDVESAVQGGGICLCYCSTQQAPSEAEYDAQTLQVARLIQSVLTSHGLKVEWDGTIDRKLVVPMTWQRRGRPARFCEE